MYGADLKNIWFFYCSLCKGKFGFLSSQVLPLIEHRHHFHQQSIPSWLWLLPKPQSSPYFQTQNPIFLPIFLSTLPTTFLLISFIPLYPFIKYLSSRPPLPSYILQVLSACLKSYLKTVVHRLAAEGVSLCGQTLIHCSHPFPKKEPLLL